jgi:hypothetical protein
MIAFITVPGAISSILPTGWSKSARIYLRRNVLEA